MTLWVVGLVVSPWPVPERSHAVWRIAGVYDSEEKAVAACEAERHFVGPVELNAVLPEEPWPRAYYPLLTESEA